MRSIYFFLFLIALFTACTTELKIPLPEHEPKLTLYAFLTEDQAIDLTITRSYGLTETVTLDDISVFDAQVELYKDGELLTEFVYVDSAAYDTFGYVTRSRPGLPDTTVYKVRRLSGAKYIPENPIPFPKANETYKFVVTHSDYGSVQAETRIPVKPEIQKLRLGKDSLTFKDIYNYEMIWSALEIQLQDPPGLGNHYNFMLGIDRERKFEVNDTVFYSNLRRTWVWPGDEIRRDPDGYTYTYNRPLSDENFDGMLGTSYWWFSFYDYSGPDQGFRYPEIRVKALSYTNVYAKFLEKHRLQVDNRLVGVESAFVPSEPVIIPSNVEGGYGVVGAYNVSEDIILDLR